MKKSPSAVGIIQVFWGKMEDCPSLIFVVPVRSCHWSVGVIRLQTERQVRRGACLSLNSVAADRKISLRTACRIRATSLEDRPLNAGSAGNNAVTPAASIVAHATP